MRKLRTWFVIFTLAVLVIYNISIWNKEDILLTGRDLVLKLAPVDPRSLMQGDYMILNYEATSDIWDAIPSAPSDMADAPAGGLAATKVHQSGDKGRAVFATTKAGKSQFVRLYDSKVPLADNEILLTFRIQDRQVRFASHSWFFQEGHGDIYAKARYGLFKVAPDGTALLHSVLDENYAPIQAPKSGTAQAPSS